MAEEYKKHTFCIKGTSCLSCEVLIEKKLLEIKNIKTANVLANRKEVLIKYENEKPNIDQLNEIFKEDGCVFSDLPDKVLTEANGEGKIKKCFNLKEFLIIICASVLIIAGFIWLNNLGIAGFINVNEKSSLPVFLIFGLMAGFSSCMALVGGLVLSMSKQWGELYPKSGSVWKKIVPNLFFNTGRIIAFVVFGAILGIIGIKLNFLLEIRPILIIIVSLIMIILAFQMLEIKIFRKFKFMTPKFIAKYIINQSNFQGIYAPFLMGALTFFIPCCFTVTAQMLALASGNAIQAGLIMLFFALGTMPIFLLIGLFNAKFSKRPYLQNKFLKIASILVLFFALQNINYQFNELGVGILNIF